MSKNIVFNFFEFSLTVLKVDSQVQVSEKYSDLTKRRSTILKSCWLMSRFVFNMFVFTCLMCQ